MSHTGHSNIKPEDEPVSLMVPLPVVDTQADGELSGLTRVSEQLHILNFEITLRPDPGLVDRPRPKAQGQFNDETNDVLNHLCACVSLCVVNFGKHLHCQH
jgi:hypothetical protein